MSVTKVTGMMQTSTKGGDITSASPCVIDSDGDVFDVSGTTNFAAFTVTAGRRFTLNFDSALTMTHHASTLDLPAGGANITTAAGDVAEFFATGTNTVQCVNYTKADGTAVVAASSGFSKFSSSTVNKNRADASGDQTISGVGFIPKVIYFAAGVGNSASGGLNIGFFCDNSLTDIGGLENSFWHHNEQGAAGSWQVDNANFRSECTTPGSNHLLGIIKETNSDGFVITWTKVGSPTATMNCNIQCWG